MDKVVYVNLTKMMDEMFYGKALTDEHLTVCYNKLWDVMTRSRGNGDATTRNLLSRFSRKDTYDGERLVKTVLFYNQEELDFRQVEILLRAIFLDNLVHGTPRTEPTRRIAALSFAVPSNKYTLCSVY